MLLTLTEVAEGVQVDVSAPDGSAQTGDLRGVFFQLADESLASGLSVSGADVTDWDFATNDVVDLGNGANVRGLGQDFDGGVELGTPGMSGDDIQSTSFVLSHDSAQLTLADFAMQDFAVRLTSVGLEGGDRADSVKIEGNAGALDCDACPEGFAKLTFEGLAAGTTLADQFSALGVTISAARAGDTGNAAMVFDGAAPTGGDDDLGIAAQGGMLIISEDDDAGDPDDNAGGGTIVFDFDAPSEIDSVTLVDIDGLLNTNGIRASGGSNAGPVLGSDKKVGLGCDAASATLLTSADAREPLPDGGGVPNARIELEISLDSTGRMAGPDAVADMPVFVDPDGDSDVDARSEDLLASGEVMHSGSATAGGAAVFMDFAIGMDEADSGTSLEGAVPDLVRLGWVGDQVFAPDDTESSSTGSLKTPGFGNPDCDRPI